jgi:dipeptidyl aminopeptidase/acylaminoacyl peptidase
MSIRPITRIRTIVIICAFTAAGLLSASLLQAQEKLSFRIDDEVTRFAFSVDGRIAYAVRHVFSEKKIQLQRDDIWVAERDGRKRRILQGEKFVRGSGPFSYLVRALRWSPDGTKLAVDLATSEMINDDGDTRQSAMTLLLDGTGGEIPIAGGDSVIPGATNAAWLGDGSTMVYLTAALPEPPPPGSGEPSNKEASFVLNILRPATGPGSAIFSGHKFVAVSWNFAKSSGVAIERSPAGIPTLLSLDLGKELSRELATPESYAGGLSISPSGDKVAYWVSNERLEVRDVGSPDRVTRVRVILGTLDWARDEKRILVKQGAAGKSGSLVWVSLPQLAPVAAGTTTETHAVALQSILHDLEFRQFDISPDGTLLAVVEPGRRNLLVYSLP